MDSDKDLENHLRLNLKKWDKKFSISLDQAFNGDSEPITIIHNCSAIKEKSSPQLTEFKSKSKIIKEENTKEKDIDYLDKSLQEAEQVWRAAYIARCVESERKRTKEWIETSWEYKKDHPECEYCGEPSDKIETHDILPYSKLTEGQRHDRNFLKQNLISVCIEHHHNVAHLGDPYCFEFEPRIKEICEQKKQERYAKKQEMLKLLQEEQERNAKRTEDFRSYVKMLPGNKVSVEKMILDNKRI